MWHGPPLSTLPYAARKLPTMAARGGTKPSRHVGLNVRRAPRPSDDEITVPGTTVNVFLLLLELATGGRLITRIVPPGSVSRRGRSAQSGLAPIAQHRPDQRQGGDRGRIGAQDARAERKARHARQLHQGGALLFGKAAFR